MTFFSEFWKLEVERVEGEAVLFLGPKSKHTQFGKMCLDPRNEKFKVEKEEDLQVLSNIQSIYLPLTIVHLGLLGCNGIAVYQILLRTNGLVE